MNLKELLQPSSVIVSPALGGKKRLFAALAERGELATGIKDQLILSKLLERERLGSTAMQGGLAIPHARLPELKKIVALFLRLDAGIDFEDPSQEKPIDLVFLLLVPEQENKLHLQALALIAKKFREDGVRAAIRAATSPDAIYRIIVQE